MDDSPADLKNKKTGRDKIIELQDELKNTKVNKRTEHAVGLLKAKIAKLKDRQIARSTQGKKGEGYAVRRTGDATAILIGFPSVGKSTLLNQLTNAQSKTAAYAFTTLTCIPGLLEYKHAKIQILDVPGIIKGAASGTGRGREVLAIVRSCDLAIIISDANDTDQVELLKNELYESNLRLDQKKPNMTIKKTSRGGVRIGSTVRLSIEEKTIAEVLKEFGVYNADVLIREDITIEQLIDVLEGNKSYVPSIVVLNKIDLFSKECIQEAMKKYPDAIPVSAENGTNIGLVKERIFTGLNFIRIFMKETGKKADLEIPLIIRKGATIRDVCEKLHRDFVVKFKFARIWGKSARFPGQKFTLDHLLLDADILQITLR